MYKVGSITVLNLLLLLRRCTNVRRTTDGFATR